MEAEEDEENEENEGPINSVMISSSHHGTVRLSSFRCMIRIR